MTRPAVLRCFHTGPVFTVWDSGEPVAMSWSPHTANRIADLIERHGLVDVPSWPPPPNPAGRRCSPWCEYPDCGTEAMRP